MIETNSTRIALPYWANEILRDKRHDRFVVTGGLGCLRGDVKIRTLYGLVRIDQIKENTPVLSWNEKQNKFTYEIATASFVKGHGDLYRISHPQGEFVANAHHKILMPYGNYLEVYKLCIIDKLAGLDANGKRIKLPISNVHPLEGNDPYYDLTVEGTANYVTEDGTIHHNSSKTTNGLLTFFINLLNNPLAKMWWVIAPTHSRIDDSVIPASVFALDLMGFKSNIHYKLVRSKPSTIRIHSTGQEIRFISADRPDLMVSATLGGYFITEAFRIKREVYENVESRARSINVDRILGILEGTPEGDTWGKDEFDINKSDPVRKLRRFILHTYDNEHNLHPSYIPRLHQIYAHNPAQIRSYIYGEFSNFRSGDVFGQYVESRNVIPDVEADPMRDINICFDFNASPLTWTAWQKMPYRIGNTSRLREICIAESSLKLTDLFQACVEIGQAFPSEVFGETKINVWGDRTGHAKSHKAKGTDFDNIKKYLQELYRNVEIKAPTQITPIRASVDVCNRMFLYELILVCESCKNLRRSYNNTKWSDKKAKVDIEKTQGETHTHHGDGTRYRLWWEYKSADINTLASQNITGINLV